MIHYRFTLWAIRAVLYLAAFSLDGQNIGVFTSLAPSPQTGYLVLPPTHGFQLLAQKGDTLSDGTLLRDAPDFTAFVAKNERNNRGYLSLNHEIPSLLGGATVFDLVFDQTREIWEITNGAPIDFSATGGISRPCSGTVTPWGTVISGEESILSSDLDSNGYNDAGWLIESRPDQRQFVQKIWKAGNAYHENCVIAPDLKTLYWGADDFSRGFVFKYVATQKRQMADGKLYVLLRDSATASTGTWVQVPNSTPAQCNNVYGFCQQSGAWNFSGIEDVEIGPYGKIYFAAKFSGNIWRFRDNGTRVSELEVFVENKLYPISTATGTQWVSWGIGADNLAFDNASNLWVLQDGGDNHIWMVKPSHTGAEPKIYLFATTPAGSEPTGITFTPNKRYMFLSFQHPNTTNSDTILDVTGKRVVFNRGTTVVIARKEFLGSGVFDSARPSFDETQTSPNWTIYPNPSSTGKITINFGQPLDEKQVQVDVYDPAGVLCYSSTCSIAGNTIALEFLPKFKGAYLIQVLSSGKKGTAKLFIE